MAYLRKQKGSIGDYGRYGAYLTYSTSTSNTAVTVTVGNFGGYLYCAYSGNGSTYTRTATDKYYWYASGESSGAHYYSGTYGSHYCGAQDYYYINWYTYNKTFTYNRGTSAQTKYIYISTDGSSYTNVAISIPALASYTVSYNANGGSGAPGNQTKYYGQTLTLSSTKPTRSGYIFNGWNTKSDGSGTNYASGASYTSNAALTLYAKWTLATSTVTLNANGGTGGTASVTATYGSAMPSATMPTRTNYTFNGYYDTSAASGGTQYYTAGGASARTWNKTGAQTLWARWTGVTSGVTLNKNGGTGGTSSISPTYGSAMPSITLPTRTGYSFQGYYDTSAATGGTQYYTAAGASARTWNKTGSQTLYARWAVVNGSIYYHAGEKYKVNNPSYCIGTPTANYQLITELSQFGMIGKTSDGTALITTYNIDSDALDMWDIDSLIGEPPPGCCAPPADAAWKIWNRNKGAWVSSTGVSSESWDVGALIADGTITAGDVLIAFANWQMETYTITLDPNGGDLKGDTERTVTYGETITNLPTPTKDRCTFKGWAISYNGINEATNFGRRYMYYNKISIHFDAYSLDWPSVAEMRLISCTEGGGWNIESYTGKIAGIAYDESASAYKYATGTIPFSSLTDGWHTFDVVFDGSTVKLYVDNTLQGTSPAFSGTRIGYHNTNSVFAGAEPDDSRTVPYNRFFKGKIGNIIIQNTNTKITSNLYNSFTIPASDITLEAIWEEDANVVIDPNGGIWNGSGKIQKIYKNNKTTLNILPPQKAGSIFLGWVETGNGSLSKHVKGNPVTSDTDPAFDTGLSQISVYNNTSGNTGVTHTWQASDAGYGNHEIQISLTDTAANPGLGGFYHGTVSAANKTYIHSFVAKLPAGYSFMNAQNSTGNDRTITWLTSKDGTGKYEAYSYIHRCGTAGTFSTFGHVYVQDNVVPVTFQLACSNMIDVTNGFNEVYTFGSGTGKLIALWAPLGVWARVNNSWKRALNIWTRTDDAWVPAPLMGGFVNKTPKGNYNPNLFTGTEITDIPRTAASSTTAWDIPLRTYNTTTAMMSVEQGAIVTQLSTTGNLGICFVRKASDINLDPDSWYTISCEAKSDQTAKPLCIGLSYYKTDNSWWWNGGANPQNFNQANSWQKFSVTFKPASDTQYICYCFTVAGTANGTATFSIKNCKLEKGVMATPWHWKIYNAGCTHNRAVSTTIEYCLGEGVYRCGCGDYQHYKICPDCGKVYVDESTVQSYMWCDECDTADTWTPYLQQWFPVDVFPGLEDSTEYQSIVNPN